MSNRLTLTRRSASRWWPKPGEVLDVGGTLVRVTAVDPETRAITFRRLRWYERAWLWLRGRLARAWLWLRGRLARLPGR